MKDEGLRLKGGRVQGSGFRGNPNTLHSETLLLYPEP